MTSSNLAGCDIVVKSQKFVVQNSFAVESFGYGDRHLSILTKKPFLHDKLCFLQNGISGITTSRAVGGNDGGSSSAGDAGTAG